MIDKRERILNPFDFCLIKEQYINRFEYSFLQSLPLPLAGAKLLFAFKEYLVILKPENVSYEEFVIFASEIIQKKYPKYPYKFPDSYKALLEISLTDLFEDGEFFNKKLLYEDNKEYISRDEYNKLKEKVVNRLAKNLILELPQSYDAIHKLYKYNIDILGISFWNDIQKKNEEISQKEKINNSFKSLEKSAKSYSGVKEQLLLKNALLSELRILYKEHPEFFNDSMIENINHIKQSCELKDLFNLKLMKSDIVKRIYYLSDYHKYWIHNDYGKMANPGFDDFSSKILHLKNSSIDSIEYFSQRLDNIFGAKGNNLGLQIVLCCVPSSSIEDPNNGVKAVIKKISGPDRIDGSSCLVRTIAIQKLSLGGDRSKEIHYKSIKCINTHLIINKLVVLLDDVTTSGNSLNACREILLKAGAKEVICVALGMTVAE